MISESFCLTDVLKVYEQLQGFLVCDFLPYTCYQSVFICVQFAVSLHVLLPSSAKCTVMLSLQLILMDTVIQNLHKTVRPRGWVNQHNSSFMDIDIFNLILMFYFFALLVFACLNICVTLFKMT